MLRAVLEGVHAPTWSLREELALVDALFELHGLRDPQRVRLVRRLAEPLPDVGVMATGAAMIVGGGSILLGVKPKIGAAAIIGFLAGVSPIMHDFWRVEDPTQRMNEMINFTKNMALLGAAVALMGVEEPWEASVPLAQPKGIDRIRAIGRKLKAA
jgi:uncharacterized membrane protein YphA (DoxX/SURF4 family)